MKNELLKRFLEILDSNFINYEIKDTVNVYITFKDTKQSFKDFEANIRKLIYEFSGLTECYVRSEFEKINTFDVFKNVPYSLLYNYFGENKEHGPIFKIFITTVKLWSTMPHSFVTF